MNIVFIGNIKFSESILSKLISCGANIEGVLTKQQSSFNADFCDLSVIAKEQGIPFKYVDNINDDENLSWIKEKNPDIVFCIGCSQLLKKEILTITQRGVIGYHPSLLPKNRGRHPIVWALVLGLEETGSTFFFMNDKADSGPIINQKVVSIDLEDDAQRLYDKLEFIAQKQIEEICSAYNTDSLQSKVQDEEQATYFFKRGRDDGRIDFKKTSRQIYNLVRGLTHPYVGAHVVFEGQDFKVWKTRESQFEDNKMESGQIIDVEQGKILVKTHDQAIVLEKHDMEPLPKKGDCFQ